MHNNDSSVFTAHERAGAPPWARMGEMTSITDLSTIFRHGLLGYAGITVKKPYFGCGDLWSLWSFGFGIEGYLLGYLRYGLIWRDNQYDMDQFIMFGRFWEHTSGQSHMNPARNKNLWNMWLFFSTWTCRRRTLPAKANSKWIRRQIIIFVHSEI